jgi:hypothetical protein
MMVGEFKQTARKSHRITALLRPPVPVFCLNSGPIQFGGLGCIAANRRSGSSAGRAIERAGDHNFWREAGALVPIKCSQVRLCFV